MSTAATRGRAPSIPGGDTLILILCLIGIWQLLYEVAGEVALSPPLATIRYAIELLASADFWPNVYMTFRAFGIALAISISAGLLLGLLLGQSKLLGDAVEPVLVALYTVPKVCFYPVILLFCGIGIAAEVAFGVIHGVIPIVIFTASAVGNIKPVLLKMARSLGLSRWQLITTVVLPAALPEIFTGLRIGFSLTLIGTLLSEMFGSRAGLGYMLMQAIGLNSVTLIMSLTLLLIVFAALVNGALLVIDKRLHRRV
jgi:NitT/TauT family transport system permease protein